MKYFLTLCLITLATLASGRRWCPECVEVEGADLKEFEGVLKESLSKLATRHGPFYKLLRINSATRKFGMTEIKDVINADLVGPNEKIKTCDIEILSQPWLPNVRVMFACPGERKIVKINSI